MLHSTISKKKNSMMVTFVSQCQKKALRRTRRVLDTFANRIGDTTWQTIITNEGLQVVQKLLKRTASKNTAVSCHWIRSRSRSELLWIVGNKEAFDESGVVAVNYGVTKRFVGEREIMIDKIYANTNGQRLDQHLFGVGYLAKKLLQKIVPDDENLVESVYVAGCWHDIGKIDSGFQEWLLKEKKKQKKYKEIADEGEHIDKNTGKFSWQKYPRHNELSLLFFELLNNFDFNKDMKERVKHTIYWHHAKPLRDKKNEIKNFAGIYNKIENFEAYYKDKVGELQAVLSSVDALASEYDELSDVFKIKKVEIEGIEEELEGINLPLYKRYSTKESIDGYKYNIGFNAKNNLARTAIVTADRLISQLTAEALDEYISNKILESLLDDAFHQERGLSSAIQECLVGFEDRYPKSMRNEKQKEAAKALSEEEDIFVGVLKGPAGCGKTKIALEWAKNTNVKKLYWICPRVQVCEGIYADLSTNEYLPNTHIEIVTGEIKKSRIDAKEQETQEDKEFLAEIVITTIDQIVNTITTHKHITTFMDFMNAHVVFDEYHEYINMQGFNLLFAELVEAKKLQQTDETLPNTLLVSATPNPLFIEKFLRLHEDNVISMESFNERSYKIEFQEYDDSDDANNPLMQEVKDDNTFVISNTAITAQRSFIEHQNDENGILFHSKFTKSDKEYLFKEVYNSFKKDGSCKYDVLRSGPVVQASLNITCKRMISEMTHAENFLQRLGRLDRFGENDTINIYTIAITEGVKQGKSKDGSSRFLNELNSLQSAKVWYAFLENNLSKESCTIQKLYALYEEFYKDKNNCRAIEEDLVKALQKSVSMIEKNVLDPKSFPQIKKEQVGVRIKKNSLRGNSLFVQMARAKIDTIDDIDILNEYAYENIDDVMTMDVSVIEGYGDSNKNLLSFMAKKHHNIKDVKKTYKDAQIKNDARDPNTPIFVSYTPEDLQKVNTKEHKFAKYYAIGIKQSIGVVSLLQLTKNKEINDGK